MNALPPRPILQVVEPLPAELEPHVLAFARALARQLAAEHHAEHERAEQQKLPTPR